MKKPLKHHPSDLAAAYTRFCHIADQLPPAKRQQAGVCGAWSPKDVVAHLIGWDQSLQAYITDPDQFIPPDDVHAFNAQSVSARQHLSWAETIAALQAQHQALQQALTTVTPQMKIYNRVQQWRQGRIADYTLHTAQLAQWLEPDGNTQTKG